MNFLAGNAYNPPANFTLTKVTGSDGLYDLKWEDRSSTEIYHLLSYKETSATTWREAQISLFGDVEIRRAIALKPGVSYQFRVRNQRFGPSPVFTDYSNIVQLTSEILAAPTNLGITVVNNETARLNWNDNSDNAMGYEIQFRADESDTFESLTSSGGGIFYLGGNDTSYEIDVPRGTTYQWRVRAVYQDSTDQSLHYSAFSNIATSQTTFPAPSNVVAVPTGLAGSVAVKWSYSGTEATQFQILRRTAGSNDDFGNAQTVPATTKEIFISGLTVGTAIEIGVRALGNDNAASAITEAVAVTPQHGFDPDWYVGNLDPDNFGTVLLTPLRETGTQIGGGPGGPDGDEDGIPDANDSHPSNDALWCDWNNNGTNDNLDAPTTDSDNDGVADNYDSHPNNASLWADWNGNDTNDFQESPTGMGDSDNDGVENLNDSHPDNENLWSDWNNNGINDNLDSPIPDQDNDRVRDSKDSHPQNANLWTDWNNNDINNHLEDFGVQDNFIVAHDVVAGTSFTSQLAFTNEASVQSRSLTGLPAGLNFADSTGDITGTPNTPGVVQSTASVTYTGGATATAKLLFRVQQPPTAPVNEQVLPNRTIGTGLTFNLSLSPFFKDPDNARTVRLATTKGNIDIALNAALTPQATANFLAYTAAGDYNGVAFHRSVSGFVVQGGGYKPSTEPDNFTSVAPRPAPRNEPGISNLRGTVAAAKLGTDPNSATHDFFFNLGDNRENLDRQNRGFTVFGRVVAGMSVVDAIAALPVADYTINLDGTDLPFDDWPMDATTAPSSMDITKTVRITTATEISPLTFSVHNNSAPSVLSATVNGTQLSLNGLTAGSSVLTIRATDYDGNHVDQTFTVEVVTGHVHPAITAQPQNQSVAPAGQATFTVAAEGSNLTYVWRKDGTPLAVQPGGPTLTLNAVTTADEGAYDVVISNATTSLTSNAATLLVTETAAIVADLNPRIVTSGQPLVLTLQVQGKPAPQVNWFKNNQPLSQTGPVLTIASAALADHGLYRAVVTNSSGTVNSATIPVVVVDGTSRRLVVKQGANASLNVTVAQPPGLTLSYQWRNGQSQNLTQGGRFDGVTRPRLNLKGINLIEGPDTYTCVVSGPGAMGSTTSGPFEVIVSTLPQVTALTDLPTAVVGQSYEHTVAVNTTKAQTPTAFSITGLPRGLTFDRATGRIFGSPLVGGLFRVRIIASNPAGPSPAVTANLRVIPMPTNTTGQFVGLIERQADVNALCGGRIDLDITDNAAYSAKVTLATGVHRLKGPVTRSVQTISNQSVTVITGTGLLKRRGLPDLTLNFTVNASSGNVSGDLRLDDTKKAALTGWKNVWHKTFRPTSESALAGAYHFGMTIPTASVGNASIPQGKGYARLTVNDSGIASLTGRTIDNKPILLSAPLGPAGSFIVFQLLYQNKGSLLGPLGISLQDANFFGGVTHAEVRAVSGFTYDQYKPAQPTGTRDYKDGFAPPVSLTVTGGNYSLPSASNGTLNAIARLSATGALDASFGSPVQANQAILCLRAQGDKILMGGLFTSYNNKPAPRLARLNANGTLDESFNASGSGANGPVYGLALDANGKILIVGGFSSYNGVARAGVARLNADGTLDTAFNPGAGANDLVECVAVQNDGAILIGGSFSTVAGTSRPGIARLTSTGTLDTTFTPGTGANDSVRCLAIQPTDQKILIGGDFTSYNGTGRVRIARLNTTGSVDTSFNPSGGANASVLSIAVHSDDRILIGGAFTTYNGQSRNRVARLATGGGLVSTTDFNPGTGANGEVRSVVIRSDGRLLIGGFFNRYNSTSDNTNGVALLSATGSLETSFAPVVSSDNRNNVRALLSLSSDQVIMGGWVWSRIRSPRILGLTDSLNKAKVDFAEGKLNLFPLADPDATFILSDKNRPTPFGSNPGATTFSYNASTGLISGRTTVRSATASRTVNYTSLLIPLSPSDYRALGAFDLAEPPDGLSITNSNAPIHTGSVEIGPAP